MTKEYERIRNETVIHADGCTTNLGIIGAICNCGAERQAEISFKAGQDSRLKEVKEINGVITQHILQDANGEWAVESWRLKEFYKRWQAFLKGLEGGK